MPQVAARVQTARRCRSAPANIGTVIWAAMPNVWSDLLKGMVWRGQIKPFRDPHLDTHRYVYFYSQKPHVTFTHIFKAMAIRSRFQAADGDSPNPPPAPMGELHYFYYPIGLHTRNRGTCPYLKQADTRRICWLLTRKPRFCWYHLGRSCCGLLLRSGAPHNTPY